MNLLTAAFRRNSRTPEPAVDIREVIGTLEGQYDESLLMMRERLAELELALEDQGWQRILADGERELSRDALRRLCALSRLMYLKNPLINRAVSIGASYVFGQGINIQCKDEAANVIIQEFLDDFSNKAEWTAHQSRMLKEVDLKVLGNLFFVLFTDPQNTVKVRSIAVDEVNEIISNPEDSKEPWYYHRRWTQRNFSVDSGILLGAQEEAYYPDWRYQPTERPGTINGKTVHWDAPVYHVRVGGMSEMRFGVPETYAALDWARAYKEFLEDVASQMRALSRFAWNLTTTGGVKGVQAAKTRLNTTLGIGSPTGLDTNPPPVAGSTFIGTDANKLAPINTQNSAVKAEDGRQFLLMVAAAVGLPESFFGDVQHGTLATAKSLDRPTELQYRDRQTLWTDIHRDILTYVLQKKGLDAKDAGLNIDFPSLLEHDVAALIESIVDATTLKGFAPAGTIPPDVVARLLLTALGVDDVDEILDTMVFPDATAADPNAPVDPNEPPPSTSDPNERSVVVAAHNRGDPSNPTPVAAHARRLPTRATPSEAMMIEAVRELRQAIAESKA